MTTVGFLPQMHLLMQPGTKCGSKIIVLGSSGTRQYCSWSPQTFTPET